MKKMKLILNESLISNKDSDILEDISVQQKPDYQIIDITVIPDEEYYPTIQSILIDLDENNRLNENENTKLDINILSETVNQKTGYSNSLFEFESSNHTITLSLTLQETERKGIYKVEAYTTKGIKVFESNTYKPKMIIESYLNSLANEYLIDKPLKESSKLNEAGEWDDYDEDNIASKNYLTEIAKYIASKVPGGDYEEARGFDAYQGPFAYVSSDITGGELWYGETNDIFQLETGYGWILGSKDELVKALSDKDYLLKLVEKTKKYIDSLNESENNSSKRKRLIPVGLNDAKTRDIINAVVGQLSDGIWENSPGMDKYWRFTDGMDKDGNIIVYDGYAEETSYGYGQRRPIWYYSAFSGKSDDEVKRYFASKIKQIVKEEGLDWDRNNTQPCDYLNYNSGVTVRDAYKVYDKLLGRIDRITDSELKESDEDIKRDLNIEPGSDEEAMLDELYEEPENPRDYAEDEPFPDEGQNITDNSDYSPEEFIQAMNISNEVYDLPIDYSEWNNMSQEERFDLVRPEMTKFVNKYKNTFDKNPQIFDLVQYNLTDANFHTEAKVMRDLYKGGE